MALLNWFLTTNLLLSFALCLQASISDSQHTFAITGILENLGPAPHQVPLRQEVDAWFTDPDNKIQVNLFLLAMAKFQSMPAEAMLSYFQIAGIHGLPLVAWDEHTISEAPEGQFGYCTHGSILFPDWHRPYVVLFEQRLHEIMTKEIIPTFPQHEHAKLFAAAHTFRMPYWDFAAKKTRDPSKPASYYIPLIVLPKRIRVVTSMGEKDIDNPMYKFTTPEPMGKYGIVPMQIPCEESPVQSIPYDLCKATSRYPSLPDQSPTASQQWVYGIQNNTQADASLAADQWYEGNYTDTLGEAVYRLFSEDYFSNYDAFASTRLAFSPEASPPPPPPDYLSIENIHNDIHNWVGGDYGHMGRIPVAAFDPIFWFHHSNVDRIFAIWQTLNPNVWFDNPQEQLSDPNGDWSTAPGTIVTPSTPLAPFHTDTEGTYYTSDYSRNWTKFGYTYPELQRWSPKYFVDGKFQDALYIADVRTQVNTLYSSTRTQVLTSSPKRSQAQDFIQHHDYVVNVQYERFALGGSPFTIHILIGEKSKVGSVYNFSTPPNSTGGHRQKASRALSKGQVHITNALLHDVGDDTKELKSLDPAEVTEYLKEKLRWTVTLAGGVDIPLKSIPSLKVSLAVGRGTHFRDNTRLSRYRDYQILHSVTEGRPGGFSRDDLH